MADRERPNVAEALALVRASVGLLDTEAVGPAAALGRILAASPYARRNAPPFRASAMDGFACRTVDLADHAALTVTGHGAAGFSPPPLGARTAARISTGAPIPDGADCVIPRERARIAGGGMTTASDWAIGANIRAIGEDIADGARVTEPGVVIGPDAVALLVMADCGDILVRRRPVLTVFATGTELGATGDAGIPDSNTPMIAASAARLGLDATVHPAIADNAEYLARTIADANGDVLVTTGGVSVGDYDLTRTAVERCGGKVVFHGVAMRPGKPILLALMPGGRPLFGLPGNPIAAFVGFRFFVTAALRAMLGLPAESGEPALHEHSGRAETTLFLRGRSARAADGRLTIDTSLDQRSHILSSLLLADCWLRVGGEDHRAFPKHASLETH